MASDLGATADEQIRFQGKVIASISHELKNALATVGESAGLLEDLLSDPHARGDDAQEIRLCAETISDELRRSFDIIRNLNVFAHTADEPLAEIEIGDLVGLAVTLSGYLAHSRPVSLAGIGEGPLRVSTCPLLLVDLLYRVLDSAFRLVPRGHEIEVAVCAVEGAVEVRLSGLGKSEVDDLLPEEGRGIPGVLHASLIPEPEQGELGIRLPVQPEEAGEHRGRGAQWLNT